MNSTEITVVRIYLHEKGRQLNELMAYLHDESRVRGVTVFRGTTGFGRSGKYHSSSLIDLALDLPLVIEFFDTTDKVEDILNHLDTLVEPGHIISWQARVNE